MKTASEESPNKEAKSLKHLVRQLADDSVSLVRQEIGLLRAEIRQNIRDLTGAFGKLAVGGGMALVGILVLVAFLVIGLGLLLGGEYWLSAFIIAVLLLGGGAGLGFLAVRGLSTSSLAPTATLETLRETGSWASEEARDFRSSLKGRVSDQVAIAASPANSIAERQARPRGRPLRTAIGSGPGHPPLDVPLHKRVMSEISDDDVPGQAAKVAFYMFGSLPPALLVIFGLTGFFAGEGVSSYIGRQLQGALPGSVDDPATAAGFISQFITEVVTESAPGPFSIGLVLGLWASSAVFVALTDALNRAYDVVDDRSWLRRRAIALAVMVGFAVLFLGGSVFMIAGSSIGEALQLGPAGDLAWTLIQGPLAFVLVVTAFFLVYYVLPDRDQRSNRKTLIESSAIAAGLWLVASFGFRLYVDSFGSYSKTYGFVGAVIVLLLWMYVTALAILVGGEIGSELEREAAA